MDKETFREKTLLYPTQQHRMGLAHTTRCLTFCPPQQVCKCRLSLLTGGHCEVPDQPHSLWLPPNSLHSIKESDAKNIGNPPIKATPFWEAK